LIDCTPWSGYIIAGFILYNSPGGSIVSPVDVIGGFARSVAFFVSFTVVVLLSVIVWANSTQYQFNTFIIFLALISS